MLASRDRSTVLSGVLLVAVACGGAAPAEVQTLAAEIADAPIDVVARIVDDATGRPKFRRCDERQPPPSETAAFAHHRSATIASTLGAAHHAQDAIALPDLPFRIEAKIAYGEVGKDLEDEPVRAWIDDCTAWTELPGARTDDDGRVHFEVGPHPPGAYALHFVVAGDGTTARATAWVLPAQTELVVFDIDGTLTTDDAEVTHDAIDERFEAYRKGSYRAHAYPHGDELAGIWAAKGFVPVYVTGRPYWLCEHSRAWLRDGSYPAGPVHTTDRHRAVVPRIDGVGRFKADYLAELQRLGYRIAAAYGNASTDVWAYAQVGIPTEHTFIIGRHAGDGGTVAIRDDWRGALPWARQHADAAQPFAWDH